MLNIFVALLIGMCLCTQHEFPYTKSGKLYQAIADRLFGPGPKLETLAQSYSLVLSNSHFSINDVRPIVPAFVEVGGLHLDETQKLSKVS